MNGAVGCGDGASGGGRRQQTGGERRDQRGRLVSPIVAKIVRMVEWPARRTACQELRRQTGADVAEMGGRPSQRGCLLRRYVVTSLSWAVSGRRRRLSDHQLGSARAIQQVGSEGRLPGLLLSMS